MISHRSSTHPGSRPYVQNRHKHVPFTAFLKITPTRGKRFETINDAEKMANAVENELETFCNSSQGDLPFAYGIPVGVTPQFGNKTARITVNGFACRRDDFTKEPVGERSVDNNGERKIGPGASNASNRTSTTDMNDLAKELRDRIESLTGLNVFRLELAHFIFGKGGVHFPQ